MYQGNFLSVSLQICVVLGSELVICQNGTHEVPEEHQHGQLTRQFEAPNLILELFYRQANGRSRPSNQLTIERQLENIGSYMNGLIQDLEDGVRYSIEANHLFVQSLLPRPGQIFTFMFQSNFLNGEHLTFDLTLKRKIK